MLFTDSHPVNRLISLLRRALRALADALLHLGRHS
jgi:hypothetical protein